MVSPVRSVSFPRVGRPLLLFALALMGGANGGAAALRVAVRDSAQRATPAAVQLYDEAGKLQMAADALDLSGMGLHYSRDDLIHYADWTDPCVRSQDPFFGSSWFRSQHPRETACFFTGGDFEVALPPGMYRLVVSKGLEFEPVERRLTVGDAPQQLTVTMLRWVNMAARGWYSGDDHVHIERRAPAANDNALLWARAEDVRVCNVLRMGDARKTYYEQYAYGPQGRAGFEATWLVPGQEDPRTTGLGHTLHLNMADPVRNAAQYYAYDPVFSQNHQRGLSGFAHVGRRRWSFHVDRGLSLLAPRGLVDFVEVAQMGYVGVTRWYEFLNLGFHLTASAGNDVPWGGTIGSTRLYAFTGDRFDSDRWFDAVKRGRTFVTTGPMLEFTVNGELPGTVLKARPGERLQIKARAWGVQPGRVPVRLKLVSFGRVLREVTGNGTLEASLEVPATRSLWVTAECETNPKPLLDEAGYFCGAVATPVYVEVEGKPTRDEGHLPALVERRLQCLAEIEQWLATAAESLQDGAEGGWESAEALRHSVPEIRRQLEAARAYYTGLVK